MGLKLGGIVDFLKAHKGKVGAVIGTIGGYVAGQLPLKDFLQAVLDVVVK